MKASTRKLGVRVLSALMALLLCVGLVATLIPSAFAATISWFDEDGKKHTIEDFLDTTGHWGHDAIKEWADFGIIEGAEGKFMPDDYIRRGDLAIVLDRLMSLKITAYNKFTDLPNDAYYTPSVLRCVAAGYLTGTGTYINPESYATRQEVCTVMARVFKLGDGSGSTGFLDSGSISSWARGGVSAMARAGYVHGYAGYFRPLSNITRAEMITVLDNMVEGFIPKKDINQSGNKFSNTFTGNVVTARDVEFYRSTIGGNLYISPSVNSTTLTQTNVNGNVIVLEGGNLKIDGGIVNSVTFYNKGQLSGVSNVNSVYIEEFASETTLDAIPNRVVLAPNTRVKISGTMYENTTSKSKTYDGDEIKLDIAKNQGSVTGGPQISSSAFTITYDNRVMANSVTLKSSGDADLKEIGVLINKGTDVPDIDNYRYKQRYYGDTTKTFSFEVGDYAGKYTYRMYAMNKDGIVGYGGATTLEGYDYSISMKLVDKGWPEKVRVELYIRGSNIPQISGIKCLHDTTSVYEEVRNSVNMTENKDINDSASSTSRLYTCDLTFAKTSAADEEPQYNTSTYYGYTITFGGSSGTGGTVQRYPVLSNTVPDGVKPVETLTTGTARYVGSNKAEIYNNKLTTKYVDVQEVGVVVKEVEVGGSAGTPYVNQSGWTAYYAGITPSYSSSYTYAVTVPIVNSAKDLYYTAFVRTKNGYYFSDVKKANSLNDGDVNGPRITSTVVKVLDDTTAVVELEYTSATAIDEKKTNSIIEFTDASGNKIYPYNGGALYDANGYVNTSNTKAYLIFDKLKKNTVYTCTFQLQNPSGVSNTVQFDIDTSKQVEMSLTNKRMDGNTLVYDLNIDLDKTMLSVNGAEALNISNSCRVDTDTTPWTIRLSNAPDGNTQAVVTFKYYVARSTTNTKYALFERVFTLTK